MRCAGKKYCRKDSPTAARGNAHKASGDLTRRTATRFRPQAEAHAIVRKKESTVSRTEPRQAPESKRFATKMRKSEPKCAPLQETAGSSRMESPEDTPIEAPKPEDENTNRSPRLQETAYGLPTKDTGADGKVAIPKNAQTCIRRGVLRPATTRKGGNPKKPEPHAAGTERAGEARHPKRPGQKMRPERQPEWENRTLVESILRTIPNRTVPVAALCPRATFRPGDRRPKIKGEVPAKRLSPQGQGFAPPQPESKASLPPAFVARRRGAGVLFEILAEKGLRTEIQFVGNLLDAHA